MIATTALMILCPVTPMHPSTVSETDAPEAAIESPFEGVRTSPGMQGYEYPNSVQNLLPCNVSVGCTASVALSSHTILGCIEWVLGSFDVFSC